MFNAGPLTESSDPPTNRACMEGMGLEVAYLGEDLDILHDSEGEKCGDKWAVREHGHVGEQGHVWRCWRHMDGS